ncbi:PEP-CTERM/exosortase system-associated acyltransferase [Glaciecola petra]|uniref:PEP-CTERM/exosortase system-associated acyltransferase n=1 Tax=Glaciecola petra TaxID=3075602 RepID=A0ABU2ZLX6_9ALTE|nr:PEP-CTERM/exosortase system-associated acyltransferase [Aestuariibacter sp. P117]MDT0593622.1 PEP-CTERM/exosortase system-associated acyltransferase [Aestuariibacter sp. P117]
MLDGQTIPMENSESIPFEGLSDNRVFEKNIAEQAKADRRAAKIRRYERARAHANHFQQEADWVFEHFTEHFTAVLAHSKAELESAFRIRHEVFCEEIKIFEGNETGLERDSYDDFAEQCLIQHKRSNDYSGCVRLIMPEKEGQILPIEKQGLQHIDRADLLPSNFKRSEIAEVSRILIPKVFRKRKIDKAACAANTGINIDLYDENDIRCFPFIAVGLYMACTAMFINRGKKHVYFMADPRLGKSMQVVGLTMTQIGPEFEYVGRRVPYYINSDDFMQNLKPSFRFMLDEFMKTIR